MWNTCSDIQTGIFSAVCSDILFDRLWQSFHTFWLSFWHTVCVRLQACPAASRAHDRDRVQACCIRRPRRRRRRRRRTKRTHLSKSRDPHLAGEDKLKSHWLKGLLLGNFPASQIWFPQGSLDRVLMISKGGTSQIGMYPTFRLVHYYDVVHRQIPTHQLLL